MNSTNTPHHQLALLWIKAFNEHNLEKLLSLYADDAQHYSPKLKIRKPETQGFIKNKSNLREWWMDAFARLPSLQYEIKKILVDTDMVFMEYVRHVAGEEDLHVGEVLEIKDGLIYKSRVYSIAY